MALIHCFCTLCIIFLLCFEQISAACKTVTVDKSGRGHFSTIQSAINSVPSNNRNWHCINVKPGTYREMVVIPYDKPFIILKGSGQKKTKVVWNEPYLQAPTFSSLADNIIVKSIAFVNSYNGPNSKNARVPAVAALINGDKSFFFRCGFSSVQDTLWDATGRHYFKRCHIEGAVDFIFGNGQSIYEDCSIRYLGEALPRGLAGFITAQGRNNPRVSSGFSNVVNPRGWNAWNSVGEEKQLTFVEYKNYGPGAYKSKRVKWLKNLNARTVAKLTSMSFIDNDGWLQSIPVKYF
ncbi:hypothetical protein F3Y22_tig00110044pilonHSYRG00175 [Hibiscus syriacus]|uniref:Pectinesterase n=1 Tax=Hibiscus syriacus TaxID=106335 RepID=A0A6A3BKM8_HIBSY|nr:hypothetical protein F3Y22_tig00110044pilonHSYRG00175 [Hibiscus syriacus]